MYRVGVRASCDNGRSPARDQNFSEDPANPESDLIDSDMAEAWSRYDYSRTIPRTPRFYWVAAARLAGIRIRWLHTSTQLLLDNLFRVCGHTTIDSTCSFAWPSAVERAGESLERVSSKAQRPGQAPSRYVKLFGSAEPRRGLYDGALALSVGMTNTNFAPTSV